MRRVACVLLLWAHFIVKADEHDHIYQDNEEVNILPKKEKR